IQEILIVVEGIAAGKEARKVILRSNEVKVEASLVRVPSARIRNTRGGLVSVSIRESRAEVVCAKRDAIDDLHFRTASIGVSRLLILNEVEAALEDHGRAEHACVSGSEVVCVDLVVAGVFLGNIRAEGLLINAGVSAQVVPDTEPIRIR